MVQSQGAGSYRFNNQIYTRPSVPIYTSFVHFSPGLSETTEGACRQSVVQEDARLVKDVTKSTLESCHLLLHDAS
jgi:hypothetical protein